MVSWGIKKLQTPISKLQAPTLRKAVADGLEDAGDDFGFGLRALIAFSVEADADIPGVHVSGADDEHGVHFGFFGPLDLAIDFFAGVIAFRADEI